MTAPISPSGRKALAAMLADERAGRPTYAIDLHPATREALIGRGLIRPARWTRSQVVLTAEGHAAACAIAAEGDEA